VDKYKQVPPFKETQNYVEQVGRRYDDARRVAAEAVAEGEAEKAAAGQAPAPVAVSSPEPAIVEKHRKLEQFVDANGRLSLRTVE